MKNGNEIKKKIGRVGEITTKSADRQFFLEPQKPKRADAAFAIESRQCSLLPLGTAQ